jgi:hypothetical protein
MGSLLVVIVSIFVISGALSSSLLFANDNYVQTVLLLSHSVAFILLWAVGPQGPPRLRHYLEMDAVTVSWPSWESFI